jgi:hypothetical protein
MWFSRHDKLAFASGPRRTGIIASLSGAARLTSNFVGRMSKPEKSIHKGSFATIPENMPGAGCRRTMGARCHGEMRPGLSSRALAQMNGRMNVIVEQ